MSVVYVEFDKMNKNGIIATVTVVLLIAAGGGLYVYFGNHDDSDNNSLDDKVTLGIFGNANGDYTLNQGDVDVIQSYVNGDISEDELITIKDSSGKTRYLADANCDDVIDNLDVEYAKSLLNRTAEKMHFLDGYGNFVSAPLNIEKIVCEFYSNAEILMLMGVQNKIVAVDKALYLLSDYYLQGANMDNIVDMQGHRSPNFEDVAEVEPDIWLTYGNPSPEKIENTNAVVFGLNLTNIDFDDIYKSGVITGTLLAGHIFDNVEGAEKYTNWIIELWSELKEKSSSIPDNEKPVVFYTGYGQYITDSETTKTLRCFLKDDTLYKAVELAGGKNLVDNFGEDFILSKSAKVDIEWIIDQEYDYLFVHSIKYTGGGTNNPNVPEHGYHCDDNAEYLDAHQRIADMEFFDNIPLDNIYLTPGDFMNNASGGLLNTVMIAQAINPSVFEDMDIKTVHQEFIDLIGYDFDLSAHGVFYKH